jgi:biotin-(acetyl-CoA carboxylase) ligase
VLTEARWQADRCLWVVTGVGINLHNPIPRELHGVAIALNEVTDAPLPEALAPAIAVAVARALHGGNLDPEEQAQWAARDVRAGRPITSPVAGTAEGVTPQGGLHVRTPPGEQVTCALGVVAHTD